MDCPIVKIKIDDLTDNKVISLLQEHHQDMLLHSPPDSVHALDIASLQADDVTFWTGWIDNKLAGCGALKQVSNVHAEIKSMRTSSKFRRQGVAQTILEFILNEAQNLDYKRLSLETGSMDAFIPARKMYEKFDFEYCDPFSGYVEDKYSVFMTKQL